MEKIQHPRNLKVTFLDITYVAESTKTSIDSTNLKRNIPEIAA